jgi:hypothetical protein
MSLSRNANAEQVKLFFDSITGAGTCFAVVNKASDFYHMMKDAEMNFRVLYSDDFTELEKEGLLISRKMKITTLAIDEMLYTSNGSFIYSINGAVFFGNNEKDVLRELTRIFDTLSKISNAQWDKK